MTVGNLVGQDMGRQLPKEEEKKEREEEGYKGRRRDGATLEAEGDKAKSRSGNDCSCSAPPLPTRRVSGVSIAKID